MNKEKGSILAIAIIFIFIFTLLGMFAMRLVILQNESSDAELYYTRAHFAALYGSELALNHVMKWENIATSDTVHPEGRKFLVDSPKCLNYKSGKWYPLEGLSASELEQNFQDEVTGGTGSGIYLDCTVEEDTAPNLSDGYLPNLFPGSFDQQYGTYKFYIIKTIATIYKDLSGKTGMISQAKDYLYFFIAYSKGTKGSKALENITEADGKVVLGFYNDPDFNAYFNTLYPTLTGGTRKEKIKEMTKYYTSAPNRSIITGKVQPIFRYYIRGRR